MISPTIRPGHSSSARVLLAMLAVTFATATASLARAQGEPEALRATVRYDDLQLTNESGAAILYGRILAAADRVCMPYEGKGLNDRIRHRACVKSAVLQAVNTVNRPTLTAVHAKRSGSHRAPSSIT